MFAWWELRHTPQRVDVPEFPADSFRFLVGFHRTVKVAAGLEDVCLVTEAYSRELTFLSSPADSFLFLVEFHRTVKVAAGLEDVRLVSEGYLH